MNVILSTTLEDNYTDFVVVSTLEKVKALKGVSTLILHNFEESTFEVGVFISEAYRNGIKKFYYINEHPDDALYASFAGVKGEVLEDEFYFEDEEELKALLEEESESETALAEVSTNIIKDFIEGFSRSEERIKAPVYLQQVTNALDELQNLTQVQASQINTMGTTALGVFQKADSLITNMAEQKAVLEQQLKKLKDSVPSQNSSRSAFGGNILYFPSYKYVGGAKVLLVREVSPCRYLTSFLLAYENYLHYELGKKVKIIFVHQKAIGVAKKYSEFTSITQESMGMSSLYQAEQIATNNPKTEVMRKLFSEKDDVFIVVDRLYGTQDIVVGTRVTHLYACSGVSDLKRYNIKPQDTIFSVTGVKDARIVIPTFKGYPADKDRRHAAYLQLCLKSCYEPLNKLLGLN